MTDCITRREFIASATAGSAGLALSCASTQPVSSYKRIIGANDRISIGMIGCGSRALYGHMPGVYKHNETQNIEFTALCDPWSVARDEANAQVKEWYGRDARQAVSYRQLLEFKNLDAVMIASCDHQHTTHLQAVAQAGLDVYVEKPLGMELERAKTAVKAVKDAGIICQVGTQLRSMGSFTGCRDLYKTGILGTVSRIEQCRNAEKPYWYSRLKEVREQDVDWKEFLMHRPMRPFNPDVYSGWYGYREFSDGTIPGWGSHYIDLVHYITGAQFPDSCVCSGGTYTWQDQYNFTCPDHVQALWTYPEGFMVSYSTNCGNSYGDSFKMFGDQGVLKLDHWSQPVLTAEGGSKNKGVIRGENIVEEVPRPDHFLNWLQCIRNRKTPHAPIEAGYQHAVTVIMAMLAYDKGRKVFYDPIKQKFNLS